MKQANRSSSSCWPLCASISIQRSVYDQMLPIAIGDHTVEISSSMLGATNIAINHAFRREKDAFPLLLKKPIVASMIACEAGQTMLRRPESVTARAATGLRA
eukprot:6192413-Pleurochrysis_carterae.AAC.5